MKFNTLKTRFETLVERGLHTKAPALSVFGTTSAAACALFVSELQSSELNSYIHLFVCSDETRAESLKDDLLFFDPQLKTRTLEGFDISPYSGLFPNSKTISRRLGWLSDARRALPGDIFIAPVSALTQKTLPISFFDTLIRDFKKGDTLTTKDLKYFRDLGYQDSPRVEDVGQFSFRGGIFDIFTPTNDFPIRIELFGDVMESMRTFDAETQRSLEAVSGFTVCPVREVMYQDDRRQEVTRLFSESIANRNIDDRDAEVALSDLSLGKFFPGIEFLLPYFYEKLSQPIDFFKRPVLVWMLDSMDTLQAHDHLITTLRDEYRDNTEIVIRTHFESLYKSSGPSWQSAQTTALHFYRLRIENQIAENAGADVFDYSTAKNTDFRNSVKAKADAGDDFIAEAASRIHKQKEGGNAVFIATHTQSQAHRLAFLLEKHGLQIQTHEDVPTDWATLKAQQLETRQLIHIIPRALSDSVRLPEENLIFLNEADFFSKKDIRRAKHAATTSVKSSDLDFGDLKVGDYVVHIQHGVALFEGLKVMAVQGVDAEFLQLTYKDKDRLYLPVYRIGQIQKFSGVPSLDKLGGSNWQKTKIKVRSHLRDLASELLQLYAKRSQITRAPFPPVNETFTKFEALFPYDETDDQLKAIDAVLEDLSKNTPMDRLVCGDVGFGKTEVALRAAFKVAQDGHQVILLVPTTVLAFQHLETFKNRFKGLPFRVEGFSRFTPKSELKKNIEDLKDGKIHIAIGTHRLLSKDIVFKNLGLLILDEEQKFGVAHKERIKKLKTSIDTLALSATPIPRTLNLSLVGIRDLSLINTAPKDRLPIRTFVCKFEAETVRKAILTEIQRGGQVFYVHNRIQSIYSLADELRALVPEARIRVGHGQMNADELEETMVAFFKHEFDVLLSTTIIESGMDIPRANTMIVDRADTFGLSQLYQLRGRIGRSKERAYCYLLIPKQGVLDPDAQERLKILQENSALGSGFRIAHHDLELRGAGNILGEEQSGNINAVGYELYLDLLEDALKTARGEEPEDKELEPDLNIRIPALIPDAYMPDIRIRLQYYKTLSSIKGIDDLDQIEADLRDQFGPPPEPVLNLLGFMLIRRMCKDLGVRDISSGPKSISIAFTERTKMPPQKIIDLALRERKRYTLTPDSRLIFKTENVNWPEIYEELIKLKKLAGID